MKQSHPSSSLSGLMYANREVPVYAQRYKVLHQMLFMISFSAVGNGTKFTSRKIKEIIKKSVLSSKKESYLDQSYQTRLPDKIVP